MKVAFIGTHGVGKTTLCYDLAAALKKRDLTVEIVREVARRDLVMMRLELPPGGPVTQRRRSHSRHLQRGQAVLKQAPSSGCR